MQKRVRCNTPVFIMERAVIRKAAKFEHAASFPALSVTSSIAKTNYQENNEDKRSLSFLHRAARAERDRARLGPANVRRGNLQAEDFDSEPQKMFHAIATTSNMR